MHAEAGGSGANESRARRMVSRRFWRASASEGQVQDRCMHQRSDLRVKRRIAVQLRRPIADLPKERTTQGEHGVGWRCGETEPHNTANDIRREGQKRTQRDGSLFSHRAAEEPGDRGSRDRPGLDGIGNPLHPRPQGCHGWRGRLRAHEEWLHRTKRLLIYPVMGYLRRVELIN